MKFTVSWLKDHLETDATLDELTYALTDLGLEVEEVVDPAERLGPFRIGEVIAAEKHPEADRLRVCTVVTHKGEQQIICGAPNARAGIKVVVAQPGDYIPGLDTTISVGKIRGVESFGMMCSEKELELSDEHDGIIELGEDAVVGDRYIDFVGKTDAMIEIAITPNRPDALSIAGIARDLAARGLGRVITKPIEPIAGSFKSDISVSLNADVAEKACPLFTGRLIKGVKNGPSPQWLQERLRAIGLRPISALVDITNYVTYDRGRPLHVFDADKVKGNIEVRLAKAGETLVALNDVTYEFAGGETVVCDDAGPEGIGGIMGGLESGCTEETVNVYLESAYFDPIATAMAGRKLNVNSDARYRFERGVDPELTIGGNELGTAMILELCGGEASEMVVAGGVPDTARSYPLDPARVVSLVGMEIAEDEQLRILSDLGFTPKKAASGIEVAVPSWRPDVLGEADLIEEIVRVASMTKLVGTPLPPMQGHSGVAKPILTPMQVRARKARGHFASLGYNECVTYSFIDKKQAELFGGGADDTALANPISSEMSHMRPSMLPGLLAAASRNQARGFADMSLFEVGSVFGSGEPGEQSLQAVGLLVGASAERDAHGTRRPFDLADARGDADALLDAIGAPAKRMTRRPAPDWFHPGRSGLLTLGPKNVLAEFGELHPKVLSAMDVKGPALAVILHLEAAPFPKVKIATRPALDISDLQAVERDFAFVVDQELEVETLLNAAKGAEKKLIEGAAVFDVFSGEKAEAQMGAGKKSVAISVRLQPREATLTDKDIEAVSAEIVAKVQKATGGTLRG